LSFYTKDPYRYALKQPMALPPGAAFHYSGAATSLLGAALAKAVGQRMDVYAGEKLFQPLGITDFGWRALLAVPRLRRLRGCG
jgi:CubicO group peptidase (beta-lactamase class C family)